MRQLAGVIVKDLSRYVRALADRDTSDFLRLCNRGDRLEAAPHGAGWRCDWPWTSDLHAPRHLPFLGAWLMRRCLADHPIRQAPAPDAADPPEVSFIIGHRGEARLPLLLATLGSIAAQRDARVECIVVQQEAQATLAGLLPSWVRLVQTPPPNAALPFCRAWAFNVGAEHARAPVLVLHDNDLLAPVDYAAHARRLASQGWDAANVKRFIFYLGERATRRAIASDAGLGMCTPETVMQNAQGGGSIVITREAFARIGGMDESFVGWGGEDNEFWERAGELRAWHWGFLPLVHLWHAPQQGKHDPGNATLHRYHALSAIAPQERIAVLRQRPRGRAEGPFVASTRELG